MVEVELGLRFVILYAPGDQDGAMRIKAWLKRLGCSSRLVSYSSQVKIELCEHVLVLVSCHSIGQRLHVDDRLVRDGRVIPVRLDRTPTPEALQGIMPINKSIPPTYENFTEGVKKLAHVPTTLSDPPFPGPNAHQDRQRP